VGLQNTCISMGFNQNCVCWKIPCAGFMLIMSKVVKSGGYSGLIGETKINMKFGW
jgi:hypothetical protein